MQVLTVARSVRYDSLKERLKNKKVACTLFIFVCGRNYATAEIPVYDNLFGYFFYSFHIFLQTLSVQNIIENFFPFIF